MSPLLLWLGTHDERLLIAVVKRRRRRLDLCFRLVTHLADPACSIGLAGGLAVGLIPGLERTGIRVAATLAFGHLLVELVKRTVVRARPCLPVGLESLVQAPDRFSFPSGHAAAAMSIAIPLAVGIGGALGLLVLVPAVLVGVSRCYLGVHYPGDVMAGWSIASLAAVSVSLLLG